MSGRLSAREIVQQSLARTEAALKKGTDRVGTALAVVEEALEARARIAHRLEELDGLIVTDQMREALKKQVDEANKRAAKAMRAAIRVIDGK